MKYKILKMGLFFLLFSSPAVADQWEFDKELKKEEYKVGGLTLTRIIDTRENQSYPAYSLQVRSKGKTVALFKGLTFSEIGSFNNDKYIIGVSNSGLSTFAYFILDASGNLLRAENHSEKFHYCSQSVTLVREWVNDKALDIREEYKRIENEFDPKDPYIFLESVTVNGCDGKRIEVWGK